MLKVICQLRCGLYGKIHINELLVRIVSLVYKDIGHHYQMILKYLYLKCWAMMALSQHMVNGCYN